MGHPGARNDITISRTDPAMQDMITGGLLQDFEFFLYDAKGAKVSHKGAYDISDNGYLKHKSLQCPIKTPVTEAEAAYSERLESIRKDIECSFGILKGRHRILRSRIMWQSQIKCDTTFVACVISHNTNLEDDGLHNIWSMKDHVDMATDENDENDIAEGIELLRVRRRLAEGSAELQKYRQTFVEGGGAPAFYIDDTEDTSTPVNIAGHLSLRAALTVHYTIAKQKNEVTWNVGGSTQPSDSRW